MKRASSSKSVRRHSARSPPAQKPQDLERRRPSTMSERDAAVTERDTLLAQNDRLRRLLLQLRRVHFSARSERLPEEQLQLGFGSPRAGDCQRRRGENRADPVRRLDNAAKRRSKRWRLPARLPRIEVTLTRRNRVPVLSGKHVRWNG